MSKRSSAQEPLILHGVTITHPDRLMYVEEQITKGDVARYYAAVAPLLLREIQRRPITVVRCPSGIRADCFYQRNVGFGLGPDVHPFLWNYKGRSYNYIYVNDVRGIMEMIQMGVVEIHPWGATIDHIHTPDRMIFDLDPDPIVPFLKVKHAALEIRQRLTDAGLESFLKCTGGKGLHVVAPLSPTSRWDEVKGWASALAHQMVEQAPDTYVATITKSKRKGKILIDFFRNDYTATGIASYSLRARPGASVAVPLEWSELTHLKSADQFDMNAVLKRTERKRLESSLPNQRLPKPMIERTDRHGRKKRSLSDGSVARRSIA
ncbi:MAG TPA: non-homologous end-joining DNA ligase [Nitrospira sp.]|nr:non-homologous end-joining DNA ligase [Nitrospira sp.]